MLTSRSAIAQLIIKELAPHYKKMEGDRPIEVYNPKAIINLLASVGLISKKSDLMDKLAETKDEAKLAEYIQTLDSQNLLMPGNMKTFIKALAQSLKQDEKLDQTIKSIEKIIYPDNFKGNFQKTLSHLLTALSNLQLQQEHEKNLAQRNELISKLSLNIGRLQTDINEADKDFDALKKETDENEIAAKKEIEHYKSKTISLSSELEAKKQHIVVLINQIHQSEAKLNDVENKHAQLDKSKTREVTQLTKTIDGLQKQIATIHKEKITLENHTQNLNKDITDEKEKASNTLSKTEEKLTATTNSYNELKAEFELLKAKSNGLAAENNVLKNKAKANSKPTVENITGFSTSPKGNENFDGAQLNHSVLFPLPSQACKVKTKSQAKHQGQQQYRKH